MTTAMDEVLARLKQLHPLSIDLSLGRIERLLARLGEPHRHLPPVIHVAGTNGKGSISAMLAAMLQAAGRRVHVYTSPHLVRFNERIALAGLDGTTAPIDERRLIDLLQHVEALNGGDPITFFEITTAAAFVAFSQEPADALVLEVGLGGRLDATNVVARPRLSIISPVSIDHADRLGETLGLIAREKAGILKRDVPAVISRQDDEALAAIEEQAIRAEAPLAVWGQDFIAFEQNGRLVFQGHDRVLDLPLPALIGVHQIVNAGTAVAAACELAELGLDEAAMEKGLSGVRWPARMQRLAGGAMSAGLRDGTELWLDGGHNPAGAAAIADTLAALEERAPKPLILITALLAHKNARGFLTPFLGLARSVIAVPVPGAHEAPLPPEQLASLARQLGFAAQTAGSVEEAIDRIEAEDGVRRIVICGSLYLAGHVLARQEGLTTQTN
ncbi:MAG: folylpolyglutamate synthase/dihydrofolate synthase family protein [Hyphomicrobiaceae bacterium]